MTSNKTNKIPALIQLLNNIDEDGLRKLQHELSDEKNRTLLTGLLNRQFQTDQEACETLYNAPTHPAYNKLKANFRKFLVYRIISSKLQNATLYSDIFMRINSEFAAFNILTKRGQNQGARYLGELILSSSIKYGFGDFVVPISAFLHELYSIQNPNRKKAVHYKNLHDLYTLSNNLEQQARIAYSELMNLFVVEFSPGIKAFNLAETQLSKLEKHLHKIPSIPFHIYTYLIIVFKYYSIKDFPSMHRSAMHAYDHIKSIKLRQPYVENNFLKKSVEAKLVLGDFEYCSKQLQIVLSNSKEGQNNWFNTLEILTTLNIHLKKYPIASSTFQKGKFNSNFSNISKSIAQRWGLLEAYINFLQLAGVAPESPTMTRYRINKFINDTPQYSEDKKGRNIQLIIAQLLFYIIDKNWDKMEEKIDALQKYGTRYLRKNELFRSQVFIKMLLEIPKRMYHPQAIIRHTAKYRKRLEEMAPNIDLNGSTLEIIPYEHLWELIIQNIVPPKYTRKNKQSVSS